MKKTYPKLFALLLLSITTLFNACKKDDNENPDIASIGEITATVNGTLIKYTAPQALQTVVGTRILTSFGGNNQNQTLSINLYTVGKLTTGVYSETFTLGKENNIQLLLVNKDFSTSTSLFSGSKVTVTITSVTDTSIKGTFTGEVKDYNSTTGEMTNKKTVTDGTFHVFLK